MLPINIIRINGWKNNKRTHVDYEIPTQPKPKDLNWGIGKIIPIIPNDDKICQIGFDLGLDSVTSVNAYNYVGGRRITSKLS